MLELLDDEVLLREGEVEGVGGGDDAEYFVIFRDGEVAHFFFASLFFEAEQKNSAFFLLPCPGGPYRGAPIGVRYRSAPSGVILAVAPIGVHLSVCPIGVHPSGHPIEVPYVP